jgi:hypothetical protein
MASTLSPKSWRSCLSLLGERPRQRWADLAEKYQLAGQPWDEAEEEAWRIVSREMDTYSERNPHKPIPVLDPAEVHKQDLEVLFPCDQSNIITHDQDFYDSLEWAKHHHASLPLPKEPIKETKEKLEKLRLAERPLARKHKHPKKPKQAKVVSDEKKVPAKRGKKSRHDPKTGSLF